MVLHAPVLVRSGVRAMRIRTSIVVSTAVVRSFTSLCDQVSTLCTSTAPADHRNPCWNRASPAGAMGDRSRCTVETGRPGGLRLDALSGTVPVVVELGDAAAVGRAAADSGASLRTA